MTNLERWVLAFGITDEIFAVAIQQKEEVNAKYLSGLVITPYVGWALGTLLGATATGLLPDSLPDTVPVHLRRNPPLFVEPAGGFVQAVRAVPQRRQTQHVH